MTTKNSTEYTPRDLVGYGGTTPDPQWPGGAKIAISLVLNYEEGSESTPVNGDGATEVLGSELGPGVQPFDDGQRDVNMESLYEYGSRAGVWRILRLFDQYQVKCTSYAVGQAMLLNPAVGAALQAAGHEAASHGWRWIDRSAWTFEEEKAFAKKAIRAIKQTAGKEPRGWYYGNVSARSGQRARALIAEVYREEGLELKYYSDSYSDDLPYWVPMPGGAATEGLLIIPYTLDNNDYREARYNGFQSPTAFADYLIGAFDELYAEGVAGAPKMMSIGLHCRLVGRPGRIGGLRKFLEHAKSKEGVWFATREEIADHWKARFPYKPVA
ncbi:carbohydrate esterase family 4 protein [Calocera viscosa TUFC12733]|uniref:Carbohydrate esterase family 4 protein n=1 Tax=Calocera viscosa (strain TUFC12733) TaxID=1330018 RepID=A0A167L929_CALVF|nr:carbohydrate esterase family 4 protein [Calocera viscosa TUFC12733]